MSCVTKDSDPIAVFGDWFEEARALEPTDPEAMALATCGAGGMPSVRTLLLKGFDAKGFVFYTNLGSEKAKDLENNPKAAILFHWKSLARQVRIEGSVEQLDRGQSEQYFHSRPRDSQIGAWASIQSSPIDDYKTLEDRVAAFTDKFSGQEIPLPDHWGGYLLTPLLIEFWVAGEFRLHRRTRFSRKEADADWVAEHLHP